MKNVLLIDENRPFGRLFALFLEQRVGCGVSVAIDGNQGAAQHRRCPADLVITQFPVPGKSDALFSELRETNPDVRVITLSSRGSATPHDHLWRARRLGVRRAFMKPLVMEEVLGAVEEELATDEGLLAPAPAAR
jgi:DNA-binding response OmpR family regulator